MASTYSDRLKLELMETGANANTWGNNTNTNLETLDAFNAGYLSKSVAGSSNITLTTGNADPSAEAANKVIELTGALTGDIVVFVPAVEGEYVFFNNTTGSQTLTIAATGHTANGIAIAQGAYSHVYNDGSANYKMYNAVDKLGATTFKDTVTAGSSGQIILRTNGAVTATTFTGDGSNLSGVEPFPSGTKQIFYQASAPTGWTQDTATALSQSVMAVTTGAGGGTGGSTAYFSSFLATTNKSGTDSAPVSGSVSGTVSPTTLSTPQLASHSHTRFFGIAQDSESPCSPIPSCYALAQNPSGQQCSNPIGRSDQRNTIGGVPAGGNGAHGHGFSGSLSSATADVSVTVPAANVKYANVIVAAKD